MNGEEVLVTGRIARTLRLAALVGAALIVVAAPAEAKKGLKLKQVTATASVIGSFNIATATATCPGKTKAVGGGYTTSPPSIPNHWLNVYESQRLNDKQWRVSGVEYFPAPAADTLAAYVYCEALKAKVKAATASAPVPATLNATTSVLALCPAGHKALSGGFSTPQSSSGAASYVSRSTAVGIDGWVVDATNLLATSNRVASWVYCAKVGKVKQRSEDTAVTGPANTIRMATTPPCPKKSTARGGGFATSTPVGGLMATALVFETRRDGGSWISSASTSGNSTSSTLVSTAICR